MTSTHQKAAQMFAAAADFLDQGQIVNRLSIALTAIALAALLLPVFPASPAMAPIAMSVAVVGLVELCLAMRVGFDAALFRRLASDAADDRLDVTASDQALVALRILPTKKSGPPIFKRFGGAKRLLILQSTLLGVQAALAIAGGALVSFEWL
jgi:hypothetical protein